MFLMIIIIIICFMIAFSHDIAKLISIGRFMVKKSHFNDEQNQLSNELQKAKEKVEEIKSRDSIEEYTRVILTMRAQQKVDIIQEKIDKKKQSNELKIISVNFISGYILKAFLSLILLCISFYYRHIPIAEFDTHISFFPFEGLISYPTGIPNAISVPIWIISSSVTSHVISSYIKSK